MNVFEKLRFGRQFPETSVDGRAYRRYKATFASFSGASVDRVLNLNKKLDFVLLSVTEQFNDNSGFVISYKTSVRDFGHGR